MSQDAALKALDSAMHLIDRAIYNDPGERQIGGTHYKDMGLEPWDIIDTWPAEQRIGAYRAGALKYTMRMGSKDDEIQEAEKGLHYQEKLVATLKEIHGK
jgi:hypothetical protein